MDDFAGPLYVRKESGLYRSLTLHDDHAIDFYSNDFLGYAKRMDKEQFIHAHSAVGATGSRLISGHHPEHHTTESYIAQYFKSDKSLLFHAGYLANVGVLSCVAQRGDIILYDEYVHASMIDGMRLSHAHRFSFQHNDLSDLEKKLQKHSGKGKILVAVESLYSMTGQSLDIPSFLSLYAKYSFIPIIDEAHAVGVLGNERKGLAIQMVAKCPDLIRIITFGKAMGYAGAAVLCNAITYDWLVNFSRPFIYTTAMPRSEAQTILQILQYHADESTSLPAFQSILAGYIQRCENYPYIPLTANEGPIQYLTVQDDKSMELLAEKFTEHHIAVKAIRPPTVPAHMRGFRICLHAHNTSDELDLLFSALNTAFAHEYNR